MRPSLIFHILTTLILVLLPLSAKAQTSAMPWCQPEKTPRIDVKTDTNRITWVYNRSKKQLDTAHIDTINPYGNEVITDVGGLMQGGIKMEERMMFGTLLNPNTKQVCGYYSRIDVSFRISPTIYIASEYPQGSCMHNAIRNHELKHINVDRAIVNKYAQLIGRMVEKEIKRQNIYGPYAEAQLKDMQMLMKERMEGIMTQVNNAMDAERRAEQQKVDSLQEYERVNHLCKR